MTTMFMTTMFMAAAAAAAAGAGGSAATPFIFQGPQLSVGTETDTWCAPTMCTPATGHKICTLGCLELCEFLKNEGEPCGENICENACNYMYVDVCHDICGGLVIV